MGVFSNENAPLRVLIPINRKNGLSAMYLLDTNVISEFRKAEAGRGDPAVLAWAASIAASSLFLSVMTPLELQIGLLLIERRDRVQAKLLRHWIDSYVTRSFAGRILDIDVKIALRCATLHVPDRRPDRDAWIAATALVSGMTVVTRNVADFEPTGVAVFNPWTF